MLCVNCGKETRNNKFCSNKCQHKFQQQMKLENFMEGRYVGELLQFRANEWTRVALVNLYGNECCICGIREWNGKPLLLEVNHKDGDARNNHPKNLEMICPNCHSQTDNFRARNKNSSRVYRKKYYTPKGER